MHGLDDEDEDGFPNIALEGEVTDRRATVRIGSICLSFASINRGARVIGRYNLDAQTYDARACWLSRDEYREARKMALSAMRRKRREEQKARHRQLSLEPLLVPAMAASGSYRPLCV